jgi:hypothetical protein
MAGHHAFVYAHGKYAIEYLLEYRFWKQLSCPAYGAVPRQLFIDVVIQKEQNIHSHGTVIDELAIANDIFKISYQAYLKEHHRINGFLTTFTIVPLSEFIEKLKIN